MWCVCVQKTGVTPDLAAVWMQDLGWSVDVVTSHHKSLDESLNIALSHGTQKRFRYLNPPLSTHTQISSTASPPKNNNLFSQLVEKVRQRENIENLVKKLLYEDNELSVVYTELCCKSSFQSMCPNMHVTDWPHGHKMKSIQKRQKGIITFTYITIDFLRFLHVTSLRMMDERMSILSHTLVMRGGSVGLNAPCVCPLNRKPGLLEFVRRRAAALTLICSTNAMGCWWTWRWR